MFFVQFTFKEILQKEGKQKRNLHDKKNWVQGLTQNHENHGIIMEK